MLLAINTSTLQFSLALLTNTGVLIGECYFTKGKGHFGGLFPALDFLLTSTRTEKQEIGCITVATGPGSFTGTRVGLATAKGLCHSLGVPIVGVSSLESLGAQVYETALPITALIESRRSDVFVSQFKRDAGGRLVRLSPDRCLEYSQLNDNLALPTVIIGNNYETQVIILREYLTKDVFLAPSEMWSIRASSVGAIGLARFLENDFDDPFSLVPVYLRPPDIRPNPHFKKASRSIG